jgi:hypothetical protein
LANYYAWLDSTASTNHRLFVFMPGAALVAGNYLLIQQEAARLGFHVVGLNFENTVKRFNVCFDATCWLNAGLDVLEGGNLVAALTVSVPNSIDNRLTKLLQYLAANYPNEGWSEFLENGQPKWSRIAVGGHSFGGGMAAEIAKVHVVARVVMFESPLEGGGYPSGAILPLPWISDHVTPSTRYYAIAHERDSTYYPAIQGNWNLLGLTAFGPYVAPESSAPPYDYTHTLVTDVTPTTGFGGLNAHRSVVFDAETPLAADGTPILRDAWDYLLSAHGHEGGDGNVADAEWQRGAGPRVAHDRF